MRNEMSGKKRTENETTYIMVRCVFAAARKQVVKFNVCVCIKAQKKMMHMKIVMWNFPHTDCLA